MLEQLLNPELIAVAITVIGAIVGIKHYKTKFHKMVTLIVKIDAAWADDRFTDSEIKDILNAALDLAGKEPLQSNIGA